MAEFSTLARPYAKAAFEYARDKGSLDQWQKQLAVAASVAEDDKVEALLSDPALTAEQQAAKLGDLCGDDLGGEARNFLAILADNKRLPLLPEISAQFAAFKANQEKSVDVEVVSPFAVEDATAEQLATALGKRLERDVKVTTTVDESLLGGLLIRAGDTVIDGSVRGKLSKLAEAMNS